MSLEPMTTFIPTLLQIAEEVSTDHYGPTLSWVQMPV